MKRSGPPARKTELKRTPFRYKPDPAKRKRRFLERYGGEEYRSFIVRKPCDGCGEARKPRQFHHAKSQGSGGKYQDGTSLCDPCHKEGHNVGWKTFEKNHGVDLKACAASHLEEWKARKK